VTLAYKVIVTESEVMPQRVAQEVDLNRRSNNRGYVLKMQATQEEGFLIEVASCYLEAIRKNYYIANLKPVDRVLIGNHFYWVRMMNGKECVMPCLNDNEYTHDQPIWREIRLVEDELIQKARRSFHISQIGTLPLWPSS